MKRLLLCGLLILLPGVLSAQPIARDSADEQAVRDCVAHYVDAFNRGDAAAIARLWSPTGVWVSPDGSRLSGREAIEQAMTAYFADKQGQTLSLLGTSIRLVAPTVAIEEGRARVVEPGAEPIESTYMAVHVKHEDGWQLDSVRETAVAAPLSNYEFLQPLQWMIGSWVDRDGQTELETTCEWTKNKNFITRSFRAKLDGETLLEGTQVIGYDAVSKSIRSWVFDTDGGIGEGTWRHDGKRWIVKSTHHQASGQLGSSINVLTPVDENSFLWQATGRELDGEILPDIPPVTVVRQSQLSTDYN